MLQMLFHRFDSNGKLLGTLEISFSRCYQFQNFRFAMGASLQENRLKMLYQRRFIVGVNESQVASLQALGAI
jgi:hypothetical protein